MAYAIIKHVLIFYGHVFILEKELTRAVNQTEMSLMCSYGKLISISINYTAQKLIPPKLMPCM